MNQETNVLQDRLYTFFAKACGECYETEKNRHETNYNVFTKHKLK